MKLGGSSFEDYIALVRVGPCSTTKINFTEDR